MSSAATVSSILRRTKFARFDPTLPQVCVADQHGDWGVKAPIPLDVPAKHLTFRTLDSKYNVPHFQCADSKVDALERLREQIPVIKKLPGTPNVAHKVNIAVHNEFQFRKFVGEIVPFGQRGSKVETLKNWASSLGVTNSAAAMGRSGATAGHVYTVHKEAAPKPSSILGLQANSDAIVAYGRPLSVWNGQTAVAVSGFIGCIEAKINNKALRDFHVERAEWDDRGRPIIKLNVTNKSVMRPGTKPKSMSKPAATRTTSKETLEQLASLFKTIHAQS